MFHSRLFTLSIRSLLLAGLFLVTKAPVDAHAEPEGWGHCVLFTMGGSNPYNYCECRSGPSQGGQYNCFIGGTSCDELYPSQCTS